MQLSLEAILHPDCQYGLRARGFLFPCAIGKGGILSTDKKREGDGATPLGNFPLRQLFYRDDRLKLPETSLDATPIERTFIWEDDATHLEYNRLRRVTEEEAKSHPERLWREDGIYDAVIVLGYNDAPIIPGKGSAIFLHIARDNYQPTEGCIAINLADMLRLLPLLGKDSLLRTDA